MQHSWSKKVNSIRFVCPNNWIGGLDFFWKPHWQEKGLNFLQIWHDVKTVVTTGFGLIAIQCNLIADQPHDAKDNQNINSVFLALPKNNYCNIDN